MPIQIVKVMWIIFLAILGCGIIFLLVKVALKIIKDPEMKWYKRLKWHLKEINKTLSHQPSHYSSKRVERMLLFVNANVMLDVIVIILLKKDKIDWTAAIAVYGAQMLYAGFQTKQISKDAKPNGETTPTT